jgi:hypothetical protein
MVIFKTSLNVCLVKQNVVLAINIWNAHHAKLIIPYLIKNVK